MVAGVMVEGLYGRLVASASAGSAVQIAPVTATVRASAPVAGEPIEIPNIADDRHLDAPILAREPAIGSSRTDTAMRGWMANLASVRAVIGKIKIVHGNEEVDSLIAGLVSTKKPVVVAFVNQHTLNLAWHSGDFAACLVDCNVLLRDGIGIEACLAVLGQAPGRNMNGTDFIPKLTAAFAGRRIAIYGTTEPWTGKAADVLAASGCRVVGTMDGFRPESDYVAEAVRTSPDLIILAMGNPKQEIVARMIAASVIDPMVIVNGGAIADFLAQRFERAPVWLQRARCEWLFRILQEPGRLWRRYLLGAFAFARSVVLLRMVSR
jgi:exopolysaccharide biosynthesis WecB/TagA/CpsF family protein